MLIWSYPHTERRPLCIHTRHDLNIFGVEFLPGSNSTKLISAAYDCTVQLHDISRASARTIKGVRTSSGGRAHGTTGPAFDSVDLCLTTVYYNHSESVKVGSLSL